MCVSPLVKRQEECADGKMFVSILIGLTSLRPLPSALIFSFTIIARTNSLFTILTASKIVLNSISFIAQWSFFAILFANSFNSTALSLFASFLIASFISFEKLSLI